MGPGGWVGVGPAPPPPPRGAILRYYFALINLLSHQVSEGKTEGASLAVNTEASSAGETARRIQQRTLAVLLSAKRKA